MARIKAYERTEALRVLKNTLKPGMTVYTVMRSVSRSGMMRSITPVVFVKNEPIYITYSAAVALGWPLSDSSGYSAIKVSGGGMDMGFHLVYTIGQVVFGDGYKLKQRWL